MSYDIVTIGGGLAGSALAKAMAENGVKVLVLERENEFRDRIRGEAMHPWGVAEARSLGIDELLRDTCANEARYWKMTIGSIGGPPRDLVETSPHRAGELDFYHPEMQETLMAAAEDVGAEIRRGTTVQDVKPGSTPSVTLRANGQTETIQTRLVVGADGRASKARRWGNFEVSRDPKRLVIAGLLYEGMNIEEDSARAAINPQEGLGTLVFPLGRKRFRTYVVYDRRGGPRHLSGTEHISDFNSACKGTGAPMEWWDGAEVAGPLGEFEGADHWVEHPYRDGVALVGDAASASDPSWGCGLSLTLRDVRVLRDKLLERDEWDEAGNAYAEEHDAYFARLHEVEAMFRQLLFDAGPEADARRARALPMLDSDPMGKPDIIGLGPESPCDEAARRRFFVEE